MKDKLILCEMCKKKDENIVTYSISTLHYIHGMSKLICMSCYKKILKDEIIKNKKELKRIEKIENGKKRA
jgi:hypothetical protein